MNLAALPGLLDILGALALIAGGAALIAATNPLRAEQLARRINLAVPRASAAAPKPVQPATSIVQQLPPFTAGLSEAEQRHVIRLFSKLNVAPARAVPAFVAARLVLATIAATATLMLATQHFEGVAASGRMQLVVFLGGAIAGWTVPLFFITTGVKQRTRQVAAGLPDALELLVVSVEAGLSLEDGLRRVTRELKDAQPALADELRLTWAEINILPDRAQALANLAKRADSPSVRSVVGILSQSLRFGTPLAQSLRTGATEMRNDQMTQMEEKASRLPALLTIPVMLFIMPTIFMIIGGPAALKLMDTFAGR